MRGKTLVTALALCLAPIAAAWAVEATPPTGDIPAGKAIAASCATCHGAEGISPQPGVPHIAGQAASYIEGALTAYRKGIRKDESMQRAVAGLNDRGIADLAAYYGSLTGFNARPQEPAATSPPEADQDPFAAVKDLTAMCAGCHGDDGNSKARDAEPGGSARCLSHSGDRGIPGGDARRADDAGTDQTARAKPGR
jgi:cytochrome c553